MKNLNIRQESFVQFANVALYLLFFLFVLNLALPSSATVRDRAYISSAGNVVSVFNTSTNTLIGTIPVGAAPVELAISPDGSRVYVVCLQSTSVYVIDTTNNSVVTSIPVGANPWGVTVSPNGARVYVTNDVGPGYISVIDPMTNTVIGNIPVANNPIGVVVSPDSSRLYVANQGSNSVSVIDTATNSTLSSIPVGDLPVGLLLNADGSRLYVTNQGNNSITVISTADNSVVANIVENVGAGPFGMALSPDGQFAYVANQNSASVSVVSLSTNTVTKTLQVQSGPYSIAVSQDHHHAYANSSFNDNLSVLDITNPSNPVVISPAPIGAFSGWMATTPPDADHDEAFAVLVGGNHFSGDQTVNGVVTASSFVGNGAGLTGITAASAGTAFSLSCTGCIGNSQLGIAYAAGETQGGDALNALALGGLPASSFAPATGSPNYAPAAGSSSYVFKTGDTMTGALALAPVTGSAPESGSPSNPLDLVATASNGSTTTNQTFRWQSVNADGTNPSARLSLLFGAGSNSPTSTNFSIDPNGLVQFAPGQSFPIPNASIFNSMLANSSLTINTGPGLTGGGAISLGGIGSVSLANNACPAGSAVTAHPFSCSPFAGLGANSFTDTQVMPNLNVTGALNGQTARFDVNSSNPAIAGLNHSNSNAGVFGFGISLGVWGASYTGVGVSGTSESGAAVMGDSTSGTGVYGRSRSTSGFAAVGVYGETASTSGSTAAAVFNNKGTSNAGNILLGQYTGLTKFSVDANGNVASSGSMKIGGGTPILSHLSQSFPISVAAIPPGTCAAIQTLSLAGAADGDTIALGIQNAITSAGSLTYYAWVSKADVVSLKICDPIGPKNPALSGNIRVDLWKHN